MNQAMSGQQKSEATGRWYYVVAIATVGLLTWIPFMHAASRTRDPKVKRLAVQYGLAAVALAALVSVGPTDAEGSPEGPLATLGGFFALAVIVAAVLQLRPLKERVYGINGQNPLPTQPVVDPAVALAIQMRERRTEARALAERDPSLARDLHIGRPDLGGNYRDGGLIELNSAPTDVIVKVAGIDLEGAERIVKVRQEWSGGFTSVEEVIVYAQVADGDAAVLRDRGMVLPR